MNPSRPMEHGATGHAEADPGRERRYALPVIDPRPTPARVTRRSFLRTTGAMGVAGSLLIGNRSARADGPVRRVSDEWMGVLVDLTECVGCRRCEWACRKENGIAVDEPVDTYDDESVFETRRRTDADHHTVVNRYERSSEPDVAPVHVKTQCMHCFEPACASACLVGAFRKTREGPVVYDPSVCIGCRYCMVACPFGMPSYTYDNATSPVVGKCSMCFERLQSDGGRPACVEMCPVEALTYGKRSELLALARSRIAREPDRYVDHIYGEHEAGGTCFLYLSPVPFDQIGFRTDIGTTPYPELTKGFLSAVPLVLTIWPALLMGAYAFTKHRERGEGAGRGSEPAVPSPVEEVDVG